MESWKRWGREGETRGDSEGERDRQTEIWREGGTVKQVEERGRKKDTRERE